MNAPSITSFIPYSTISILLLVLAFKYELAMDMLEMNSQYFNLSKPVFLLYFVIIVVALMFFAQMMWFLVLFIRKQYDEYFENIRLEKKERAALIAIFNALNGSEWKNNSGWCTKEPLANWKGVKINPHSRRVNKLILPDNNITGETHGNQRIS